MGAAVMGHLSEEFFLLFKSTAAVQFFQTWLFPIMETFLSRSGQNRCPVLNLHRFVFGAILMESIGLIHICWSFKSGLLVGVRLGPDGLQASASCLKLPLHRNMNLALV